MFQIKACARNKLTQHLCHIDAVIEADSLDDAIKISSDKLFWEEIFARHTNDEDVIKAPITIVSSEIAPRSQDDVPAILSFYDAPMSFEDDEEEEFLFLSKDTDITDLF